MKRSIFLGLVLCVMVIGCTAQQKENMNRGLDVGEKIVNGLNTVAKLVAGNRELIEDRFGDAGDDVADGAGDVATGTMLLSAVIMLVRNILNKKGGSI